MSIISLAKLEKVVIITYYVFFFLLLFPIVVLMFLWLSTIKTFIFALTLLILLFLPAIYFFKKFKLKYLLFLLIPFLFILINSFQLNNAKDWDFELRSIWWSEYNFNILNNISENEFLKMWFLASWFIWITNKQLDWFKNIEEKYEKSLDINLPSQIPNAIINKKQDKYFIYNPEKNDNKKAIVVLHWSAWWFLFYLKFFKQIADENNSKLIIPAFWWWNWNENWWSDLVFKTYNDLISKNEISKDTEITLIWLSAWWMWLSRVVYNDNKNIFKKIIYVSWLIENDIISSKNFLNNEKNKDFLIIQWKIDDRVFYQDYLDTKNNFTNLEDLIFDDWDHFILLNKQEKIIKEINNFIKK